LGNNKEQKYRNDGMMVGTKSAAQSKSPIEDLDCAASVVYALLMIALKEYHP
jgi:hypothetical protein